MKWKIGCDIIENTRININDDKLVGKILSQNELYIFKTLNDDKKIIFVGGRWAAKESIYKATQSNLPMSKIDIKCSDTGLSTNILNFDVEISISHEKNYSIAMCIAKKNPI